jgi:hypothetical protein
MAPDNVRLNYTISSSIDEQLSSYCEITGRTASDLVRQLITEVLEGDRQLPHPSTITVFLEKGARRERRTDMWLSSRYLKTLEERLIREGYPSKSGVIAYLLHNFLTARANHAGTEMVRVTTLLDRLTLTKLMLAAETRQTNVEALVADLCSEFINHGKPVTD